MPAGGHMTAGLTNDQFGYLIAPYNAFPKPIRRTLFNRRGDRISPIDNDNCFFNVSPTIGEHVMCSGLRDAGEVFDRGAAYRDEVHDCAPFGNDGNSDAGADTRQWRP